MAQHLPPGTVLDGRYRIDAALGQGGFGITYAAENVRLGLKVAVKELFWRDHSARAEGSQAVALPRAADVDVFEEQKRRFLREARTLKDFADQPGVVRVLDYFEANGTAYIVMEYVEGETLAARCAAGPMPAEDLIRGFLPLMDTLGRVHGQGVIHRDISPENIMVQPDGSLKLIDFGAARQFKAADGGFTSLARDSYSPSEQYDKNGKQGPWTDVYALCATLYSCLCGAPPQSAVQRIFLDELQPPSALGVAIDPACEAALMKGLKLWQGDRFKSMEELSAALRAALPGEEAPADRTAPVRRGLSRRMAIALAALALCAALALGLWLGRRGEAPGQKEPDEPVEHIRVTAPSDMTASEFAAAQTELRARLDDIAGEDRYSLEVRGDAMDVTLPVAALQGQEVWAFVTEHFRELAPGKTMNWQLQILANWEDPAEIALPGAHQVSVSLLQGETLVYAYQPSRTVKLSASQYAANAQEIKRRLDALNTPYAFGTLYGDDTCVVFRLSPERMGRCIEDTLGKLGLSLAVGDALSALDLPYSNADYEIIEAGDGRYALRLRCDGYTQKLLDEMSRAMVQAGLDRLYLGGFPSAVFASARVEQPIDDGVVVFDELRLKGVREMDESAFWVLEYLTALGDTNLTCSYTRVNRDYLDASGAPDFDLMESDIHYGIASSGAEADDEALLALLERIRAEKGYGLEDGDALHLTMALPLDDDRLPETISGRVAELIDGYGLGNLLLPKQLIISTVDETASDAAFRVFLYTSYDLIQQGFVNHYSCWLYGDAMEPWAEALSAWWQDFEQVHDSASDG